LRISLYVDLLLAGLCGELEAIAGHNVLEDLIFEVPVDGDETEFHRIYYRKSGEGHGTGQTWVVCVKTSFLSTLNRMSSGIEGGQRKVV
jgi:hypothetical protein